MRNMLLILSVLLMCASAVAGYSGELIYPGDTGVSGMETHAPLVAPRMENPVNSSDEGWYFHQKYNFLFYDTFADTSSPLNPGPMMFGEISQIWAVVTAYSPPTTDLPYFSVYSIGDCGSYSKCEDFFEFTVNYFPVRPILETDKVFLFAGEDNGIHPEVTTRIELLGVEYTNDDYYVGDDINALESYYTNGELSPKPSGTDRIKFIQMSTHRAYTLAAQSMVVEGVGYTFFTNHSSHSTPTNVDLKLGFGWKSSMQTDSQQQRQADQQTDLQAAE